MMVLVSIVKNKKVDFEKFEMSFEKFCEVQISVKLKPTIDVNFD